MRPWFAIPAAGAVGVALGAIAGGIPLAVALGLAAAAVTAAGRSLMGESPGAIAASVVAALVVIATLVAHDITGVRSTIAVAALAWTIAELARASVTSSSPVVAMLPAIVAGVCDAGLIVLVPIAAARLVTAPWKRPRWVIAAPIAGAIATLVAAILCLSHRGDLWAARAFAPGHGWHVLARQLDIVGPLVVVPALVGLSAIAGRSRYVQAAMIASLAGAVLADLRAGSVGAPTICLAGLFAGLAIGRLAGQIRFASAQAIVAATIGFVLVFPAAWGASLLVP